MLGKYLAALWSDWVARMSGVASVILAFLAAYLEFIVKNGRVALWATAAVCFVVASYRIWAKEHKALLAKQAELERLVAENDGGARGRARRKYLRERLGELLQEGEKYRIYIGTPERHAAWVKWVEETRSFLAQEPEFDKSYLARFEAVQLTAIYKFIKEFSD
jgi:hypothetical protein